LVNGLDAVGEGIDRPGEADALAAEHHLALVGVMDPRDALDQRRLAGAVVAEEGDHLAGVNLPAHVVDRGQPAEALGEVADGEDGFGHGPHPDLPRPMIRSRDWSISTAMITTEPTTMNCQKASTLSMTSPVVSTAMISAPM